MSWGSKQHATQLASITSAEQFFSSVLTLGLGDAIQFQIQTHFGSATDAIVYTFYSTLDSSSENWDNTVNAEPFGLPANPILVYPGSPDPVISLIVKNIYKVRVGARLSGAGSPVSTADLWYRAAILL